MWSRGYRKLGGSQCLDVEKNAGNPKAILLLSLSPKKREGLRGGETLLLLCTVYTRSSQMDFCVVIHLEMKWDQI